MQPHTMLPAWVLNLDFGNGEQAEWCLSEGLAVRRTETFWSLEWIPILSLSSVTHPWKSS